jgi:homoserine kinase
MARNDPRLVGRGMGDSVVTPARAKLIDGYNEVCTAAMAAGAAGVTISGAGPTVIAACTDHDRRRVANAMLDAFEDRGTDARAYQTRVGRGAEVFDS